MGPGVYRQHFFSPEEREALLAHARAFGRQAGYGGKGLLSRWELFRRARVLRCEANSLLAVARRGRDPAQAAKAARAAFARSCVARELLRLGRRAPKRRSQREQRGTTSPARWVVPVRVSGRMVHCTVAPRELSAPGL